MNFLKKKSVIISIVMLTSIILFASLSLVVANLIRTHNDNEKSNLVVEAAYTFNDSSVDNDEYFKNKNNSNYKNNTDFYITTPKGLFCFSVSVAYGCSFEGKNVYLKNDIDWNTLGWNFPPIGGSMTNYKYHGWTQFKGTFDGQGNTINGLKTKVEENSGFDDILLGLFANLYAATIKNVRIKNFTVTTVDFLLKSYNIGGIAGALNGTTISNCVVENFVVTSGDSGSYIGGIVGHMGAGNYNGGDFNGEISNVLLQNFTVTGSYTQVRNLSPGFLHSDYKILNCVANVSNDFDIYDSTDSYIKVENVISKPNEITGLSVSSLSGDDSKIWYYSANYNDGYPYLRQFITWATIKISVNNSTYGKVSHTEIEVPNDITSTFSSTTNEILIMDTKVTATPKSGYQFKNWTSSGYFSYTANFEISPIELSFNENLNATCTGCGTYYVLFNAEIEVDVELYANGTIKEIEFSFNDKDGTSRLVKYVANDVYYIKEHNLSSLIIKEKQTVIVTTVSKTYDTMFS